MSLFFFFKQKTAYDMRISDWSSDVCSSDLYYRGSAERRALRRSPRLRRLGKLSAWDSAGPRRSRRGYARRSPCGSSPDCRHRRSGPQYPWSCDRKSVVWGKSVSVRVDLGGRRIIKKKTEKSAIYVNI